MALNFVSKLLCMCILVIIYETTMTVEQILGNIVVKQFIE